MAVLLRKIDETNRGICLSLCVGVTQQKLVASNARSLQWCDGNQKCVPLGVYDGAEMVGFAMYEPRGTSVFSIHRLMIDQRYQGRGIGFAAMKRVMDEIASLGGETIYLSFRPENDSAKALFQKLGYVFQVQEPDGEIVYRYGPERELGQ